MRDIKRKGAKSAKDITEDILEQLNRGEIETANLVEWLSVNQRILLENILKQTQRTKYTNPIFAKIDALKKQTVNTINEAIGLGISEQIIHHNDDEFQTIIYTHSSDLVRCWATYTIGKNQKLTVEEKLKRIQPFAADHHFGVREISWLSVRESISKDLAKSIEILSDWGYHQDENIRRFASESTRPRGVWCEHINELKQNPELCLAILEPLKSDHSKYVRDSVGNWLNDASKTKPDFVLEICQRWEKESPSKETAYIIKKALRTINK